MLPRLNAVIRQAAVTQFVLTTLLALLASALFFSVRDQNTEEARVRERLVALEALRGDVASTETGLRGFVIVRRDEFLEPYARGVPAVRTRIARLMAAARSPEERALLTTFHRVFDDWRRNFANRVLVALADRRQSDALVLLRTGAGKRRVDRMRAIIRSAERLSRRDLQRASARADRALTLFIATVLAVAAVIGLSAIWYRRRLERDVVRPITRLTSAAKRFGEGDFTQRAPRDAGFEELAVVGRTFNVMATEVEGVVSRLQEVDAMKSSFVSSVSHELRTPLTSIIGYLDALIEGEAGVLNEEQEEYATIVLRNARRLHALIDDLLLLARMEADRLRLHLDDIDMSAIARSIASDLLPIATDKGLSLHVEAPPKAQVQGDALRLTQAVTNLVSNAVKFTAPGGLVEVRVAREGHRDVRVDVCDSGVGIPAAEIERLAERFFRASTAGTAQGTGLGLAITREIVDRHGGRLQISSDLGVGSRFGMILPVSGPSDG